MSATSEELEIDRIGKELFALWASTDLNAASMIGSIPERIGAPLMSDNEWVASRAASCAARLDAVNPGSLRSPTELTRRYLRFELGKLTEAVGLHKFDLRITPYRIGFTLAEVHRYFEALVFANTTDLERYTDLLQQYQQFLVGTLQNLHEQAALGIVAPTSALPGCLAVVKGLAKALPHSVGVSPKRLVSIAKADRCVFLARVKKLVQEVQRAFSNLCKYIECDYASRAPEQVGLSQYTGGREAYDTLIRHYVTIGLSADDIHRRGVDLVQEIEDDMAAVRVQLKFRGSARDFAEQIKGDCRFYRKTPEEVGHLYAKLLETCEAAMPKAFGPRTFARCGVKRLAPESEAGMTFGYYQPPLIGEDPIGYYRFNGSNLDQRLMIGAASLIYHELVPGHHLHFSTEMGNATRPLVRRLPTIAVFNEGWAEYAADLGFELGLYDEPYARYGRYLLQALLASRLVVDTGLNALGWNLKRGRDYLLEHTAQSPIEIESEILRYATGMPGQGLTYAPGRKHFWQVRRAAERCMGSRFDLPAFHEAILDGGSLPLMDLTFSIEQWSARHLFQSQ